MYRLDWIEQLKLRVTAAPKADEVGRVNPTVWKLGFTSLLTDISSEMVNSVLPMYVILHLRLSPLQYGAIDGIYHGVAVALLGILGGAIADRTGRPKEVAFAGYGISAICKLLLLAAGGAWGLITLITAIDRTGKGARTAPRDAILSLSSNPGGMATAFAVHRALDAGGSLLGPIVAFALIQRLPGRYEGIWMTSFVFALLGLAVLWLFVRNPNVPQHPTSRDSSLKGMIDLVRRPSFRGIALAGSFLGAMTVSDGFLYLSLQQRSGAPSGFFPLFYVVTAICYAIFSIPMGWLADRLSRTLVLLMGYGTLCVVYVLILSGDRISLTAQLGILGLMGAYYAATEGVLMAIASSVIPAWTRTRGLALLTTGIGLGKMCSSLVFGWIWQQHGIGSALALFAAGLLLATMGCWGLLKRCESEHAA